MAKIMCRQVAKIMCRLTNSNVNNSFIAKAIKSTIAIAKAILNCLMMRFNQNHKEA